jgi:hypothetical protein
MRIILRKLDYSGYPIYGYNIPYYELDGGYQLFLLCSKLVENKNSVSAYIDTISEKNKYIADYIFLEKNMKKVDRTDVYNYFGEKAIFLYVNRQIYRDIHNPVLEPKGHDYIFICDGNPISEVKNVYEKIENKCNCKEYNIFNIPEEYFDETWMLNGKFSGHPVFLKNQYPNKTAFFYRKFPDIEGNYNNFLIHEDEYFSFIIS